MFHSWNQAFRFISFLEHSPNTNLAWCQEQHKGLLIWPYYIFPIIRCPDFMIITPSFSSWSVVFSNQRFNNCSSTTDIGFVKLLSGCFCGNGVFKLNIKFCCCLCCSSSDFYRQSSSMYCNPLHLFLVFSHYSFLCLSMICVCHHNLENSALDTLNKVAIFGCGCFS